MLTGSFGYCCETARLYVSIIVLGCFVGKHGGVCLKHKTRAWTEREQQRIKAGGVVFFGEH